MRVELFMIPRSKVACCSPTTTLNELATLLVDRKIGSVVVMEGDMAVGIATKSDLVTGIYKDNLHPDSAVSKIMSKDLITVEPDTDRDGVADLMMNKACHHVIVAEPSRGFLGLTTAWDVAKECALDMRAFPWSREAFVEENKNV